MIRLKRIARRAAALLIALSMLPAFACRAADYDWAVMVYLCGSDLESDGGMATGDLFEMMAAKTNGRACFLVETGGAAEWQNDTVDGDQLERYLVEEDSGVMIDSVVHANMGDAATLAAFLRWAMSEVSAEHYGLILWNHGSGSINGVCFDELNDNDSLSLTELDEALADIPKLDFIGFDACLMATYETAATLSGHADYLIASEETEPGSGWDYTAIGTAMGRGASVLELGRVVCDSFYDACKAADDEAICTLSVVDLSKLDAVTERLNTASAAMSRLLTKPEMMGSLSQGISRTENYGGNNDAEGYTNMIDLGDLMTRVSASVPEASACLDALKQAVVYQVHGSKRSRANGLSIYYPLSVQGSEEIKTFEAVNPCEGYVSFVKGMLYGSVTGEAASYAAAAEEDESIFGAWDSFVNAFQSGETEYAAAISFAKQPYFDEDGVYRFQLDADCLDYVQSVRLNLSQYLYEDDAQYYLGDDNNVNGDWETGEFWDNFDGAWPSLPDNQELMYFILEEDDAYTLYSSPILLNGREMYLRFAWVWDDPDDDENGAGEYVVIDAWDGLDETGASGRGHVRLRVGDEIVPIYYGYGADDEDVEEYQGEACTVTEDFALEELQLREGAYDYCFEIIDIWGNSVTTDSAIFYVDAYGEIEYDE